MQSKSTNFFPSIQFPFLEFLYFENGDPDSSSTIPVYQINLLTSSEQDYGLYNFDLVFEFVRYPTSTANSDIMPLAIQIDPCIVEDFQSPADLNTTYVLGENIKTIYLRYS